MRVRCERCAKSMTKVEIKKNPRFCEKCVKIVYQMTPMGVSDVGSQN